MKGYFINYEYIRQYETIEWYLYILQIVVLLIYKLV